tara:strand:+ start:18238 stop:18507 length:270 start_codon:yes stop_codon:yes gene_type:complete
VEDDNVISTPMYDNKEEWEEYVRVNQLDPRGFNKGPYYVPWKETSMKAYEEYIIRKRYKRDREYIPGSTLGNMPTKKESDKKDDTKKDN